MTDEEYVRKNEQGATMVEFTLVFPLLLIFSVVSLDLLRVAYQQLSLQYVLVREKREVLLGTYGDADTIRNKFNDHLQKFGLALGPQDSLTLCPMSQYKRTCMEGTVVAPPADTLMFMGVGRRVDLLIMSQSSRMSRGDIELGATSLGMSEPQ